ncbi:MAG: long-chain-acyl-CoA synthetase [Candidatus Lokiarchaeota archaeon]|nr:long-chain-acyl-CoA synthetase [Candidatus Lokiarchaeota archaeon]
MLEKQISSDSNIIDPTEFNKRFQEFMMKHGKLFLELGQMREKPNISWGYFLEKDAEEFPDNPAIKFEDKVLTYKEFNDKVNQYANYFISLGLKKDDVVKVLIKNRIELLIVYSANAKIGVISSLINTDLRKKTLVYSLNLTPGKIIIVGEECYETFNEIKSDLNLSDAIQLCFIHDSHEMSLPEGFINLPHTVLNLPVDNPSTTKTITPQDIIAYIFTSGTTGLPKAALLSHARVTIGGFAFGNMIAGFTSNDTIYISLPFFHGTALMTGWPCAIVNAGALAIARKFSTSQFWDDIRKHNATCFSYVGEICRYLMNQPPKPDDSDNPVRAVIGNGLRPDIWDDFKKRFDIPYIGEFYGSSEGNGAFANLLNFDCTCGYSTGGFAIIRYNHEEDKPIRNENGFFEKVGTGEVGLLLFESTEDAKFRGYTDENATEAKLLRNVLKEGDLWFNTGDLMLDQGNNHAQFVDRLGDTFRWKGHNVSTTEIEEVLNIFDQISMSCVYGAKIPATDGRAGMATIVPTSSVSDFEFIKLQNLFNDNLAPYAIPVFLRFKSSISTTQTFKFKKLDLKNEGFNLQNIEDPLFVMLPDESEYKLLTKEIYEKIQNQGYSF